MTIKAYKVTANYIVYLEHVIMAKDEDEAFKIAQDLDGGEFRQVSQDDWCIDDVKEIKQ